MVLIQTFITTAVAVTFWELVKQVGVRLTQQHAPTAVAEGLVLLDRLLPQLLKDGATAADVEHRLRQEMGQLTGSDWTKIRSTFSLGVFLDHLADARKEAP